MRRFKSARGHVERLRIESDVLRSNMLGDSTVREIDVYIPADHDGRGLPLLMDLAGFTSGSLGHTNWKAFGENLPERLDRLIGSRAMQPCVVVFPDCFTKLGGNQYINSAAMGLWADFLTREVVPFVEERFACGGAGRRGLFGKSSGGYGSIAHAMLYPDVWSAAACHSGDMGFELCYLPEFPRLLRKLVRYENSVQRWLEKFFTAPKLRDDDLHELMTLAMCATYDPDPSAYMGIRLPVTMDTCEIIPERWQNFLNWDPCVMVQSHGDALRQMKALWIDCGDLDQYNLVHGARRLHQRLLQQDIPHIYEEFPDNHSSIDYRLDRSLPHLVAALS